MVLLGARLSTIFPSEVTQFAEAGLIFGRTTIKPSKVTFTGPHSAAFSARPISKSHTVVTTRRRVTRSAELSSDEYLDLWRTVAAARDAAMSAGGAAATHLLLKDGVGCGAAVPHLHVHIVPRVPDDFFPNDKVFSAIEGWAPSLKDELARPEVIPMDIPNDADRKDRTFEMMAMEAGAYRAIMGGSTPDRDHTFGRFPIDKQHIFAQSKGGKTVAFVNLRPLVPGHVLVTPRRLVARTSDLTEAEADDLWMTVRRVQAAVEEVHGADASEVGVQDGRDAGQTVPHVHVHIIPRRVHSDQE